MTACVPLITLLFCTWSWNFMSFYWAVAIQITSPLLYYGWWRHLSQRNPFHKPWPAARQITVTHFIFYFKKCVTLNLNRDNWLVMCFHTGAVWSSGCRRWSISQALSETGSVCHGLQSLFTVSTKVPDWNYITPFYTGTHHHFAQWFSNIIENESSFRETQFKYFCEWLRNMGGGGKSHIAKSNIRRSIPLSCAIMIESKLKGN